MGVNRPADDYFASWYYSVSHFAIALLVLT
jgi:hypothetical protein